MSCPMRVVPASEESKTRTKLDIGRLERFAVKFKIKVFRHGDEGDGWEWEGFVYTHDALDDADHNVAFVSEYDCLCAALEAITELLIGEGWQKQPVKTPAPEAEAIDFSNDAMGDPQKPGARPGVW